MILYLKILKTIAKIKIWILYLKNIKIKRYQSKNMYILKLKKTPKVKKKVLILKCIKNINI